MPKAHKPRSGSMQFWPRKRASRPVARVRSWAQSKDAKLLGFAGYKAGMTHILIEDNRKNTKTKGEKISIPVSVIECPPLRIASVRLYSKTKAGMAKLQTEVFVAGKKELAKSAAVPKKQKNLDNIKPEDFDELRVIVSTQPKLTSLGKKKPEMFEMAVGGKKEEALDYVKANVGKDITVSDVFEPGKFIDVHAITKGKGTQGPVKRFGVSLRSHKSEKVIRGPGSIAGGWKAQGHMMYRVAMAGQMGYHTRTEYNKQIISIMDDPEAVNPKGGFIRYGLVKNNYILVKGSVGGSRKRLVRLCQPIRKNPKVAEEAPKVLEISTESRQRK